MSVKVTARIDDQRGKKLEAAIERGLRTVGVHMSTAASRLTPVDLGRLRASITWATARAWKTPGGKAKASDGVDIPMRTRVVHIGTNVEYAAMQEYGGLILPKTGKYLAIPINPMAKGKSPWDFNNTFILKRGVALYVAYRPFFVAKGKGNRQKGTGVMKSTQSKAIILFRLKKSVFIPAQSYLRKAFDEEKATVKEIFSTVISRDVVNG